jgi:hypothetical protein
MSGQLLKRATWTRVGIGLFVLCAAVLGPSCGPARADDFLPLAVGNFWEYVDEDGDVEIQVVVGTAEIWGTEVHVVEFQESPVDEGLLDFWTSGPDGNVCLWGFWRDDAGWGLLYDPPVRFVDAPLSLGKEWENTFDAYGLPDTLLVGTSHLSLVVTEEGDLTVPAGVFHSFGIATDEGEGPGPVPGDYTILGRRRAADGVRDASQWWWSDGVGQVQYGASGLFQLSSYFMTTPAQPLSWTRIKAVYRE